MHKSIQESAALTEKEELFSLMAGMTSCTILRAARLFVHDCFAIFMGHIVFIPIHLNILIDTVNLQSSSIQSECMRSRMFHSR